MAVTLGAPQGLVEFVADAARVDLAHGHQLAVDRHHEDAVGEPPSPDNLMPDAILRQQPVVSDSHSTRPGLIAESPGRRAVTVIIPQTQSIRKRSPRTSVNPADRIRSRSWCRL